MIRPSYLIAAAASLAVGAFSAAWAAPAHHKPAPAVSRRAVSATHSSVHNAGRAAHNTGYDLIPRDQITPLSEIHAGMEGYGLTVFHGTTISRFHVTVVSILHKMYMGKDMILIRMSGGPITERGANIIAGMSGSPVYLKGKLAGAVSMGYEWPKEPVAMVTPIKYMEDSFNPRLPTKPEFSAVPWSRQPLKFASEGFQSSLVGGAANEPSWQQRFAEAAEEAGLAYPSPLAASLGTPDESPFAVRPLLTPIYSSGLSPQFVDRLNRVVAPFGLTVAAGIGGGSAPAGAANAPLEPGSMMGVFFCTGDIQLGGYGTVTYRRGNQILAFGHPLEQLGPIDFPLGRCYVNDVFSAYPRSEKLCEAGKLIGSLVQDRPWSVMGEIHKTARTVPLTINVSDEQTGKAKTFHIQCADHPLWTGVVADMAASEAVSEVRSYPGDSMADVRVEVDPAGMPAIVRSNTYFDYFSPDAVVLPCLADMDHILDILQSNPFQAASLDGIKVSIHIHPGRRMDSIARIVVDKSKVAPGDIEHVDVTLRPWKGEPYTVPMDVRIPSDAANGPATLMVSGGMLSPLPSPPSAGGGITIIFGGGNRAASEPAANLHDMIARFLKTEKNNDLVARVVQLASPSLNVNGQRLYNLPPALSAVLKSPRATGTFPLPDEAKTIHPMSSIVLGAQGVAITIQRKEDGGQSVGTSKNPTPVLHPKPLVPKALHALPVDTRGGSQIAMSDASASETRTTTARPADDDPPGGDPSANDPSANDPSNDNPSDSDPSDNGGDVIVPPGGAIPAAPAAPKAKTSGSMNVSKPIVTTTAASDGASDTIEKKLQAWTLRTPVEFGAGEGAGVAVGSLGDLAIAPRLSHLRNLDRDDYIWAALPNGKGSVYLATGNSGRVYLMNDTGQLTLALQTPELDVLSLAAAPDGTVYAGTAPNGYVYRVSPGDSAVPAKPFFKTGKNYVLSLAVDKSGNVFAGTNGGAIYRINPAGSGTRWFQSDESHICALAMTPDGDLIAGTSPSGLVYRISPDGHYTTIWDSSDTSISALAAMPDGDLLAGTAPKGIIVRFHPGQADPVTVVTTKTPVHDMTRQGDDVYAVSGAAIYQILPSNEVRKVENQDEQELLCVAPASKNRLVVGTGNIAAVYVAQPDPTDSTYRTEAHDAGAPAHWGHIRWDGSLPDGAAISFETRTGNNSLPDASWSGWTAAATGPDGAAVESPSARYIQIRAHLTPSAAGKSPIVRSLSLTYLPDNRPPSLTITTPVTGSSLHGKVTLEWQGQDPDNDALLYHVQYSADGGATWKAPSLLDKDGKAAPAYLAANSYQWDTRSLKDGAYLLKVTVSDRRSNPTDPLQASAIVDPLVVNTHPQITVADKAVQLTSSRSAEIDGVANGQGSPVVSVSYRIDKGAWFSAAPVSGIFDSSLAHFKVSTDPLPPGAHTIEIQAVTAAGDKISTSVPVGGK
ncbi:MAG TPA: SpoIVB peptidase S55 domain-containing protein [Armatimonadota bacterium]|nr:SpoIVB peptidase S55 domain-containing protein [Armatimonadota bacterium]